MKHLKNFIFILLIFTVFSTKVPAQNACCNDYCKINQNLFDYLNYSELVELSKDANKNACLKYKTDIILNNPIIDNSISPQPNNTFKCSPKTGQYIRVASWNIDRGLKIDEIKSIFTNPDTFMSGIKTNNPKTIAKVKEQLEILRCSDIIVLNEVDSGMPRTGYKRVVEELGKTLGYNYAYGVEFLEVDPTHLGLEYSECSEANNLICDGTLKTFKVDKCKYRGLHGNAILSRFPLKNVRILRLPQYYDWYDCEKREPSKLEDIRRSAAKRFLKTDIIREIRIGSRMA
jgi:hypothetical protein